MARIGVRFLRQLFVVGSGLLAYSLVRGATQGKPALAVRNAHRLLDVERFLGLAWERTLQDGVIRSPGATRLLNGIYIYGHWPMIAVTLGWLLTRHPAVFVRTRNAMLASGAVGLVFFITFPVAPPRLAELGLVDTVTEQSHAYRLLQPPTLTDQYAAMPSLHVGWNLLLALAIATTAGRTWQRAAAMAMPVVMTAAVVLTANHYILDAAIGAALTGIAWLLTGLHYRLDGRGWALARQGPVAAASKRHRNAALAEPLTDHRSAAHHLGRSHRAQPVACGATDPQIARPIDHPSISRAPERGP